MLYASQERLKEVKEIAQAEASEIIRRGGNVVSIFVYGSVARGDITNSSDIDMAIILDSDEKSYHITSRNGVIISEEFHPKSDYIDVEKLNARVYDGWIIYDPTDFLRCRKSEFMKIYFTPRLKSARISGRIQSAKIALARAVVALSHEDFESLPLHLRDFSENAGHVIVDMANKTPSMRRFIYNMKDIATSLDNPLLYEYMVQILGSDKTTQSWIDSAIDGVKNMQKLFYTYPLNTQDEKEREIMSSLLSEEYVKGTQELAENGELESALFPCLLWESMVLFRRNPVMRSFFTKRGENWKLELGNPLLVKSLKQKGFMEGFFAHHSKIVGSDLFTRKEYEKRLKTAETYLNLICEMYQIQ